MLKGAGYLLEVVSKPGYNPLRRLITYKHGFCELSHLGYYPLTWCPESIAPFK